MEHTHECIWSVRRRVSASATPHFRPLPTCLLVLPPSTHLSASSSGPSPSPITIVCDVFCAGRDLPRVRPLLFPLPRRTLSRPSNPVRVPFELPFPNQGFPFEPGPVGRRQDGSHRVDDDHDRKADTFGRVDGRRRRGACVPWTTRSDVMTETLVGRNGTWPRGRSHRHHHLPKVGKGR